jgi:hypothetical protein
MTTTTEETAHHAPDLDAAELTEFEAIEVHQVKGVGKGANGFPHLLLKGLAPPAEETSAPDAEPAEVLAGTDAMAGKSAAEDGLLELMGLRSIEEDDALGDVAKDSRTFTAAERKKHAAAGQALPDGSYPIPDKDALRRAAILARSGHGDVKAAKRLIARRARELGVPNPLDEDDKASSSAKAVVAEEATTVDTEAIDQAVAKALASSEERFTALEGELSKAKAMIGEMAARPVHGGPVLSAAAHHQVPKAETADWAAKAAAYRQRAEEVSDRQTADGYRQLAREADDKAKALTPG